MGARPRSASPRRVRREEPAPLAWRVSHDRCLVRHRYRQFEVKDLATQAEYKIPCSLRARRAFRPADPGDKNYADDRLNEAHRNETERGRPLPARGEDGSVISIDAARMYAEGHFDWVYLDALHTRDAVLGDLQACGLALRPQACLPAMTMATLKTRSTSKEGSHSAQRPPTACSQCRCAH